MIDQGSDVVGKDINGAAIGEDGFSVFVGATGTDDTDTDSTEDLAAIKLDVDGNMEWIWQVRCGKRRSPPIAA